MLLGGEASRRSVGGALHCMASLQQHILLLCPLPSCLCVALSAPPPPGLFCPWSIALVDGQELQVLSAISPPVISPLFCFRRPQQGLFSPLSLLLHLMMDTDECHLRRLPPKYIHT